MDTARSLPHRPPAWPPSLQLLLGESAAELWAAVLAPLAGRLRSLTATSVTLRPDSAATVRHTAVVDWADGRSTREFLAATTGAAIPAGAAVVEGSTADGPVAVGLWRWPLDPALPGLAWATSAAGVSGRLTSLGIDPGAARLRLRAYRPGRRAVVEVSSPAGRWFLKVVRPTAAAGLAARHTAIAAVVPAPPVLAATDDGVLVLPGLPGTPMRVALSGDAQQLPDPLALEALLDRLPVIGGPARRTRPGDPLPPMRAHSTVLRMVCPDLAHRLERLDAAVAASAGEHPLVPVHGDFYESQLLVRAGAVTGLLDVDTAGPGARIDDWATLVAHLALLERLVDAPAPVAAYRRRALDLLAGRWPAGQLEARVAGVLVGLATGPFRVQQAEWAVATEARVALAEEWAGLR
ncbi:aminoglycoside phosphotransferase family protein [Blastococcus saxobsidens]|uniref:Aminoglycoside phosphotransferase family protein n=1 Tax=Blastococcus saxobsidens TaxID=138336 RepID=A0A6L9VXM8_9ACTN|nr:aminoglycoside phosphotransferase family protein [Blastococcus saxobsidens]NEK84428.1 aminoglycoside phosphotransferase family protein [Blastococcus saxobsidens]